MALQPGTRLGPYEILSALGVGGMGEVYRARDGALHRDVALKVLPEAFASDADRLARFRREAQMLAALNHPNIAAIYGFEESTAVHALVLEMVEGPTLADRIAQGAIPVDEALPIARQIAEALEAAHEQGIIHRDLKPANIKLRPDGTVKVLDFGLAKAMGVPTAAGSKDPAYVHGERNVSPAGSEDPAYVQRVGRDFSPAGEAGLSQYPTITSPPMMTGVGTILGTAAYMSPEQAKGRAADQRSDVWAFGCVLYEMLTGARPFDGEDMTEVLGAVVRLEPNWEALPAHVPQPVRTLLQRCLVKDRRHRIAAISTALFVLDQAASLSSPVGLAERATTPLQTWRRLLPWAAAAVLGVALTFALVRGDRLPSAAAPVRFGIVQPAAQALGQGNFGRRFAISPDGSHLVYLAGTGQGGTRQTQLVVRAFERLEAEPMSGTSSARSPFISPDNRWAGFFAGNTEIKKVPLSGGSPITLCRIIGLPLGASWGTNDTIVFATADPATGLMSVPSGGGEPRVLTRPDAVEEGDHIFPSVLPGGRAVLFTIMPGTLDREAGAQVAVLDLETGQQKTLIRGGRDAEYVESGHLVYANAGTLRAVRFDPVRLEVLSNPVPVAEAVEMPFNTGGLGRAQYAVSSATGTLVYISADLAAARVRSLVWVDRSGREAPIVAPPRAYYSLRLSPNGDRVALDVRDQENDIWVFGFVGQALTRLTFNPGNDNYPVWTPDGRRIVFNRSGGGLLRRRADGAGAEEQLTMVPHTQFAMSFSPDGQHLVVTELKSSNDLSLLSLDGTGSTRPLVQTTFTEGLGELSPDGRWLAYQSNETGRDEIYVRPFPDVDSGRWQVSSNGGTKPVWAHSGRELFFLDRTGALMTVSIRTIPAFSHGTPTKLFDAPYFSATQGRSYDVSPDGRRFLFIKDLPVDQSAAAAASMVVVLNWVDELKRLVPVN